MSDETQTTENSPEIMTVAETNESGNDMVDVLLFDIVISPGSSVSVFYHVVVKSPNTTMREFSASFARTQDNVVVDTVAGASSNNPGQGVNGALDVLPAAFETVSGDGASCILSGLVGGKSFFFRKPVELPKPE